MVYCMGRGVKDNKPVATHTKAYGDVPELPTVEISFGEPTMSISIHNNILFSLTLYTGNFPPNITAITETSNTSSLQDNRILQLEVGANYTYQIQASDPNEDVIMYSLLYDGLGASITQGRYDLYFIIVCTVF